MVEVIGDRVLFIAVKAETFPIPLPASPIAGFEFVHV
jgi:hypothetical protein